MAVLALGLVGTAVGTSIGGTAFGISAAVIGGFIGSAVGSYIDSTLIFPLLFEPEDQKVRGPRIDDFQYQTASEGSGMNFCMGARNRVAGTLIWQSSVREVVTETETETGGGGGGKGFGGGGGGGGTVVTTSYTYYQDVAVGVCEGAIDSIDKIYADSKLIYRSEDAEDADTIEIVSDELSVTVVEIDGDILMRIDSPVGGPNITVFNAGDVEVSGFSNGDNNGTFEVERDDQNPDGSYSLFLHNEDAVNESAGEEVTLIQVPTLEDGQAFSDIEIKFGTHNQSISSIIDEHETESMLPAFRGTAYVVFKDLFLDKFGRRTPVFSFVVRANDTSYEYKQAISLNLRRAGVSTDDFDISSLSDDQILKGYTTNGPQQTNKILEPLLIAGNINVKNVGGVLTFYPRGEEVLLDTDETLLGPYKYGDEPPEPLSIQDGMDSDLPVEVNISFVKDDEKLERSSRSFQRVVRYADVVDSYDLPITMTNNEAANIAINLLWDSWNQRNPGVIYLPPSFVGISEGMTIKATQGGEGFRFRVTQKNQGHNFLHELHGIIEDINEIDPGAEDDEGIDEDDVVIESPIYTPPALSLKLIDAPALQATDVLDLTHYYGVCASQFSAPWGGASLFVSQAEDGIYGLVSTIPIESKIFITETVLAVGPMGYVDRINTVDVLMLHGVPESCTGQELLTGTNRIWLGEELIGFQNATALGGNRYRLSILLRGLRNTENGISLHTVDEVGTILDGGGIKQRFYSLGEVNVNRYFKAVPTGLTISDVKFQVKAFTGRTVQEFCPAHVLHERVGTSINVSWVRRTRAFYSGYCGLALPLVPGFEKYEIDLLDPLGDVFDTYFIEDETDLELFEADRVAAGYDPADPVIIVIYTIGEIVHRGVPLEIEVG